ncbi:LURP1-like domain [Macleaya cordata]|uniref:LURP1-like domain n=1 Tax=Macleaya cordata TaxID=56857 RepID=A0A200R3D6_MACCD|nr:LURP1-like domain [Macleaya cordata]
MDQAPIYPPALPQPSYTQLANPIVVIAPHFCAPYPVDLTIVKKVLTITEGNFEVLDVNGSVIFKVKGALLSLRDRRLLLDGAGNPLVSLQQKILTAHRRWQVYKGDSSDSKALLFSVKKSSLLQFKTHLHVFLASNTKEDVCDFRIEGSWLARSCVIYHGDSSNIVAQMHKKHSVESLVLGKDTFTVTVYPNVDYAFIVALVVVLYEINEDRSGDD